MSKAEVERERESDESWVRIMKDTYSSLEFAEQLVWNTFVQTAIIIEILQLTVNTLRRFGPQSGHACVISIEELAAAGLAFIHRCLQNWTYLSLS